MMRIRRLSPPLVAISGLLGLLAGAAQAAPATARVESTRGPAAADCPDADALAAIVNDGLGRPAILPAGAAATTPRRIAVSFERAGRGYAATVRISGPNAGTRELANDGPGCGALASAVGVLLVVLLDSNDDAPAGTTPPAQTAGSPAPAPATARPISADVAFGGGVAEGLVGGWSPALGLGGTLAYQRWAARLGGVWLPSKTSDYGPGRVEIGLAVARLALCAPSFGDRARWTLALCVQQQVGWMRGRGIAYDDNRVADRLWLAAGLSIVAGGPLGRSVGWELEAGAVRVLRDTRFVIGGVGTAFESDPFAFMTTLAFTTRVW
jgi:hypothetical protein